MELVAEIEKGGMVAHEKVGTATFIYNLALWTSSKDEKRTLDPIDTKYVSLDDGRKLCLECLDSAIMDTSECQPLYFDIQEFYEGLNMKVEQQILKRPMIGAGNRIMDMITGPYRLTRRCEVTAILILYGLPRVSWSKPRSGRRHLPGPSTHVA
ncbi:Protein DA1-related 1 [Acorus gramineus]|uniref:Protein DA1-related 1 n=1 Tax=Acorus gramineus TaxID=55184 RepID=A0AAV9AYK4_ACOGR|nr:Protein DA1-related 1 [Acorus gramineus]